MGDRNERPATAAARPVDQAAVVDVMRLVAHGDRRAFSELYDLLGEAVFVRCLCMVGGCDRDRAEVATRETFLAVWRAAPRADLRRTGVLDWVFGIADRCAAGVRDDVVRPRSSVVGGAGRAGSRAGRVRASRRTA